MGDGHNVCDLVCSMCCIYDSQFVPTKIGCSQFPQVCKFVDVPNLPKFPTYFQWLPIPYYTPPYFTPCPLPKALPFVTYVGSQKAKTTQYIYFGSAQSLITFIFDRPIKEAHHPKRKLNFWGPHN